MAYFLWDNEGVLELMEEYENDQTTDFIEVFSPVEKVDIFRIVACKWFGGIVSPSAVPVNPCLSMLTGEISTAT